MLRAVLFLTERTIYNFQQPLPKLHDFRCRDMEAPVALNKIISSIYICNSCRVKHLALTWGSLPDAFQMSYTGR